MRRKIFMVWACFMLLMGAALPLERACAETLPVLVIGSDEFEPYNYVGADGTRQGVDVELATEALRRMGYTAEFRDIVWENKDDYLEDGTVDCLWGSFSMNGREDNYTWAGPYLCSRQVVVTRVDSGIASLADLEGKRIAVQATGKAEGVLIHGNDPRIPEVAAVYCFSTMDEVYASLRKNYVDAIAGHENALKAMMNDAPESFVMLPEALYVSQLGVAFRKGTHEELAAELAQTLDEMRADGTIAQILQKYGLDVNTALGVE